MSSRPVPNFERLRDVAAQLAGLLVLAASGAGSAAPDHPMLRSAEMLFHESTDGIRRTRATDRARAHHAHLTQAAGSLEAALAAARDRLGRPQADLDPILTPLRAGYDAPAARRQRAARVRGCRVRARLLRHRPARPTPARPPPALPDLEDRLNGQLFDLGDGIRARARTGHQPVRLRRAQPGPPQDALRLRRASRGRARRR